MWTPATRRQHSRIVTRYQTDLTDAEWRVIAPHLPKPSATGRPREWPMREIVNGIFYVTRAGCPWRLLPNDLPPWGTIYRWFAAWRDDGRFERINHALVMADRERVGREASPSAAIITNRCLRRSAPTQMTSPPIDFGFTLDPAGYAGGFYFASASIRASNAEDKLKLEIGDEENRIDCCDRCGDPALFLRQGSWASRP